MLRLAISRSSKILPKNLTAFPASNAVDCLTNRFKQTPKALNNPRWFSLTTSQFCEFHEENAEVEDKEIEIDADAINNGQPVHKGYKKYVGTSRDRTKVIPYETSIEYLKSRAYQSTYGDKKVWELYRRVHKGQLPRQLTRKSCIRSKVIITGSPCPICRDEYLVLDHRNLELLKQFVSPFTGEILSFSQTGLCQRQHAQLEVCIERAYDLGLLEYEVPFREFDYADYYDVYKKPTFTAKHGR